MKRILIALVAIIALVACAEEETITVKNGTVGIIKYIPYQLVIHAKAILKIIGIKNSISKLLSNL